MNFEIALLELCAKYAVDSWLVGVGAWGTVLISNFPPSAAELFGCRLTDLELTTRHSRFGINTAVAPAPIENFYFNDPLFSSTVIVVSQ